MSNSQPFHTNHLFFGAEVALKRPRGSRYNDDVAARRTRTIESVNTDQPWAAIASTKHFTLLAVDAGIYATMPPSRLDDRLDAINATLDAALSHSSQIVLKIDLGLSHSPVKDLALPSSHHGVDCHGQPLRIGGACVDSPTLVEDATERCITTVAKRIGSHRALKMVLFDGPWSRGVTETFDGDHIRGFQWWLSDVYRDIDTLNSAWQLSSGYSSFDEVDAPRDPHTTPQYRNDWRAYNSRAWLELFITAKKALQRVAPDVPVSTTATSSSFGAWKWAQYCDVLTDTSPIDSPAGSTSPSDSAADSATPSATPAPITAAFHADLTRSLAQGTGDKMWMYYPLHIPPAYPRPGVLTLRTLSKVAHGANAVILPDWVMNNLLMDAGALPGRPGASPDPYSLEATTLATACSRMERVAMERPQAPRAAIVIGWDNYWSQDKTCPLRADIMAWYRAFYESRIPVDFVHPYTDLSTYQIVIAVGLHTINDALLERLEQAVHAGVQVVIGSPLVSSPIPTPTTERIAQLCGLDFHGMHHDPRVNPATLFDRAAHPLVESISQEVSPLRHSAASEPYSADNVARVTSCDPIPIACDQNSPLALAAKRLLNRDIAPDFFADLCAHRVSVTATNEPDSPAQHPHDPAYPEALLRRDDHPHTPTQIIAQFGPGAFNGDLAYWPAITRRAQGQGAWWYIATYPTAVLRMSLLKLIGTYGNVFPLIDNLPDGVEYVERGSTRVFMNHSDKAREIPGAPGYDLMSDATSSGHIVLPPRSGAVIATPMS